VTRILPWGARGGASGCGGAHHRQRRARRRPSLPVEKALFAGGEEKKKKEKWWVVDSLENEASDFFRSLRTSECEHCRFMFDSSSLLHFVIICFVIFMLKTATQPTTLKFCPLKFHGSSALLRLTSLTTDMITRSLTLF
jgi:hypothetical protein